MVGLWLGLGEGLFVRRASGGGGDAPASLGLVQAKAGTATTASVSPAFDAAPTSGNLVVLAFAGDAYNDTVDSGWTESSEMEQQTFHGGYLWWQVSDGNQPPSYSISMAASSVWAMAEFEGTASSPYVGSQGQLAQSSASSYTSADITPTAGESLLVAAFGGSNNGLDLDGDFTAWLNSFVEAEHSGNTGGSRQCIGLAYRIVTADGQTAYSTGVEYPTTVQARTSMLAAFAAA